jgi:hypothetical protein
LIMGSSPASYDHTIPTLFHHQQTRRRRRKTSPKHKTGRELSDPSLAQPSLPIF